MFGTALFFDNKESTLRRCQIVATLRAGHLGTRGPKTPPKIAKFGLWTPFSLKELRAEGRVELTSVIAYRAASN